MRTGTIGAALCVLGGLCMIAGVAVAACLFVPGALLTYDWMRSRIPPQ